MEFKRVFSTKIIFLLIILVFMSGIMFYMTQQKEWREYCSLYSNIEVSLVETYERFNTFIENHRDDSLEEIDQARQTLIEENILRREESGETSFVASNTIMNYLLKQSFDYVNNFESSVDYIIEDCNNKLEISLFNNKDSFTYQSIIKTRFDYMKFKDLNIRLSANKSIDAVISYRLLDYFIFVFLLIISLRLHEQKKSGIWEIVHSTEGGRGKNSVRKIGVLFISTVFITSVFYICIFLESLSLYKGFTSLNDLIQCSSSFFGTSIILSKATFMLLYIAIHSFCSFIAALLLTLLFNMISSRRLALFVFALLVILEYLCFTLINGNSVLGVFKFFNLLCLISPSYCIVGYYNLSFAGIAIDKIQIIIWLIIISLFVLFLSVYITDVYIKPHKGIIVSNKVITAFFNHMKKITEIFNLFLYEIYISLFIRKGIIFIAVIICLAFMQKETIGLTYNTEQLAFNDYINSIDPRSGEGTEEYILYLDTIIEDTNQKIIQRKENNSTDIDLTSYYKYIQNIENIKTIITERRAYKTAIDKKYFITSWIVQDADYNAILESRGGRVQDAFSILSVLLIIMLNAGTFNYAKNKRINYLIESTINGRKKLTITQILASLYVTCICFLILYGIQFIGYTTSYNLGALKAPIQSLPMFENYTLKISIGQYILWMYLYRLLILEAITLFVLSLSKIFSYYLGYIVGLLLLFPHYLSLLGISIFEKISIITLLSYYKLYIEYGYGAKSYLSGSLFVLFCLLCSSIVFMQFSNNERRIFKHLIHPNNH